MVLEDYEVKDDDFFIIFCDDKNLSINSQKKYANALKNYTTFHQLTLEQLLDEADEEEENNVRLSRRKIRSRLISFRTHLINDLGYKASTIKTNLVCAKSFYRYHGIAVPEIPNAVLTESPNDSLEFDDLPTINDIKTAIESTKKAKHKALFLFAACNGSARMELTTFKFKQFLEGVSPFCNKPKTPQDIIDELDGKCEELEVIPVFKMKRQKTNYSYYAPITPECTQFCINYLKAEGLGLKPDDPFFQLSKDGVSTAFKLINEKFNWGKRGLYGFYSSHRIRKFNASAIEDTDFANFIQGRKPDPIKETYFKKDINRVRDEYKKHMHKFTVYAHYDVMINSEAYNQLKDELAEEKQMHHNEVSELKQQLEIEQQKHQNEIDELKSSVGNMQKQMDNLTSIRKRSNIEKTIYDFFKDNYQEDMLKNEGKTSEVFNKGYTLCRIAYGLAIEEEYNFRDDKDYLDSLIKKAMVKYSLNPKFMIADQKELINIEELETLNKDSMLFIDLFELIKSNDTLWNMVKDDQIKLKNIIVYIVKKNQDNIDNLTNEDKEGLVQEVLMEYLTVD